MKGYLVFWGGAGEGLGGGVCSLGGGEGYRGGVWGMCGWGGREGFELPVVPCAMLFFTIRVRAGHAPHHTGVQRGF